MARRSASRSDRRSSVHDAFTSGGAQVAGGQRAQHLQRSQADLDYVRGHRTLVRTGIVLDNGWHNSDDTSNYLGTYTFENLDAFTPESSAQLHPPARRSEHRLLQPCKARVYVQDDIRVRKSLTLSPGVRYEALRRTCIDHDNIGPRFGVTWSPLGERQDDAPRQHRRSSTTGCGNGTYEQTLRVDGVRQQELNILNPSFPDPGAIGVVGVVPPINR